MATSKTTAKSLSREREVRTVTANTEIIGNDDLLLVDATAGNVTVILPVTTSVIKRHYTIKKIDSSANTVTLSRSNPDKIEGSNTYVLTTDNEFVQVYARAGDWQIIATSASTETTVDEIITTQGDLIQGAADGTGERLAKGANGEFLKAGASKAAWAALAASDVQSGTFADARISESSVTQHEAALAILSSQVSGQFDSERIDYTAPFTGSVLRTQESKNGDLIHAKDFGVVGDYDTDDTSAIDDAVAYVDGKGLTLDFGDLVCRYTGTLTLPEGIRIIGNGAPRIATFPQFGGDKSLLRPGFKHLISGAAIIFDGTGTTTNFTTVRSDKYASVTPMVIYDHFGPPTIEGVGFIQDMDVYTAGGTLTTGSNDNRATAYNAGMVCTATLSRFSNVTIFGYLSDSGLIIYGEEGGNADADYNELDHCLISSGLAIIGHDTAAGASTEGLTGVKALGTGFYGADHHTRADGIYTVPSLYIDGYIVSSDDGIRGHSFVGCNFRTLANDAISLDHCDDITMSSCIYEFSLAAGVTDADANGIIAVTSNTVDIRIISPASTHNMGMDDIPGTIAGSCIIIGDGLGDQDIVVADAGAGVRIRGAGDDSIIQLTKDFTSSTSDWTILRDNSASDDLEIRYDNAAVFNIDTSGAIQKLILQEVGATIASGVITAGTSQVAVSTQGGAGTDDLDTINGGTAGQILTLRAASSSNDVVVKDGTGNIRCAGDFTLTNGQDRIVLQYDGATWNEISRSDNTA